MSRPPKIWQNGILCHIWHIQISILVIIVFARIARLSGSGSWSLYGVVVEWYLSTASSPFVWLMSPNLVLKLHPEMPHPLWLRPCCAGFASRLDAGKKWARCAIAFQQRSTSRLCLVRLYTASNTIQSGCCTQRRKMPQRRTSLMWSLSSTICRRISKVPMVSCTSR